ncbi:MAG: STAS/SEC14 domain-containing protein [Syntrophales bacterium]|nr:STAS/SEC14 domain-containing protein [Syntrophales bacterium]MDD5642021.1 STAS/SEC14 domain-containing protein [Syntrophales bacterium]
MVKVLPGSDGNLLGIQVSEKLTARDYEEVMVPQLVGRIQQYGKARFLCYMDETFAGMELGAMLDDAKFFFKYKNDLERMAVVGAVKWIEVMTKLFSKFIEGEMQTFASEQLAAAWEWIKA